MHARSNRDFASALRGAWALSTLPPHLLARLKPDTARLYRPLAEGDADWTLYRRNICQLAFPGPALWPLAAQWLQDADAAGRELTVDLPPEGYFPQHLILDVGWKDAARRSILAACPAFHAYDQEARIARLAQLDVRKAEHALEHILSDQHPSGFALEQLSHLPRALDDLGAPLADIDVGETARSIEAVKANSGRFRSLLRRHRQQVRGAWPSAAEHAFIAQLAICWRYLTGESPIVGNRLTEAPSGFVLFVNSALLFLGDWLDWLGIRWAGTLSTPPVVVESWIDPVKETRERRAIPDVRTGRAPIDPYLIVAEARDALNVFRSKDGAVSREMLRAGLKLLDS